jgi:hypothetical protein
MATRQQVHLGGGKGASDWKVESIRKPLYAVTLSEVS